MTEFEKMINGQEYNTQDKERRAMSSRAKNLIREYNMLPAEDINEREKKIKEILGKCGKNVRINQPFYVDYGCNISVGDNVVINMNCTFLDTSKIIIGNNVLIAPDVKIYTAVHPLRGEERMIINSDGSVDIKTNALSVTIGNDVWIGGGTIIISGVTIGNNVVIGAGSVVAKSIPDNVIAYGNPCKVVRENK